LSRGDGCYGGVQKGRLRSASGTWEWMERGDEEIRRWKGEGGGGVDRGRVGDSGWFRCVGVLVVREMDRDGCALMGDVMMVVQVGMRDDGEMAQEGEGGDVCEGWGMWRVGCVWSRVGRRLPVGSAEAESSPCVDWLARQGQGRSVDAEERASVWLRGGWQQSGEGSVAQGVRADRCGGD
jgi:hypothetical protein